MAECTCTFVHTEFIGSKYKKIKLKIQVHEQHMITSLVVYREVTVFQILQQALRAHASLKWKETLASSTDWRVSASMESQRQQHSWVLRALILTDTTTATSSLFVFYVHCRFFLYHFDFL